ncbi:MAG: THUMP domain-containing protein [Candidatus Thorarchaeota archaeon]
MSEILIRYGELGLKSRPVRRLMEKQLANNIRIILEKKGFSNFTVIIEKSWGRLFVSFNAEEHQDLELVSKIIVENVFGIISVSPIYRIGSDIEIIKKEVLDFARKNIPSNSSFVVRARRTGKHTYTSIELERTIGELIYDTLAEEKNLTVNLTNPDYKLSIEVKDNFAFIYENRNEGFGGFPQGLQGGICSIFRGSKEDAVASFLLCKRGALTLPILFQKKKNNNYSNNIQELDKQVSRVFSFQPLKKMNYFVVDFDQVFESIGPERIQCSQCDQICIGIVERIISNNTILGITLGNSSDMIQIRNPEGNFGEKYIPIYYPLVALNTNDIPHIFGESFQNKFCLESCPGYKNQKNKKINPLTQEEILSIVANASFSQSTLT